MIKPFRDFLGAGAGAPYTYGIGGGGGGCGAHEPGGGGGGCGAHEPGGGGGWPHAGWFGSPEGGQVTSGRYQDQA
jgi:hypothetical protein